VSCLCFCMLFWAVWYMRWEHYASTLLASHALSLSSAFPRCEILFFSLLSISAYVVPSYSKHESQPGCPAVSLRCGILQDGHLPKTVGPLLATSFPSVLPWKSTGSWPGPSQ
jgi:hypothetical protein